MSRAPLPLAGLLVAAVFIGLDIFAASSIYRILAQTWVENAEGCVVHGMWMEKDWRRTGGASFDIYRRRLARSDQSVPQVSSRRKLWSRRRRSISSSHYSWVYTAHLEVSLVGHPESPHVDACYYSDCDSGSTPNQDSAAYELDKQLKGACSRAGYEFDAGLFDLKDTGQTNRNLMSGINCAWPRGSGQMQPPGPPAGRSQTLDVAGTSNVGSNAYFTSADASVDSNHGVFGDGALANSQGYGGFRATECRGCTIGGTPYRVGPPCQCSATYRCWYDPSRPPSFPHIKLTADIDVSHPLILPTTKLICCLHCLLLLSFACYVLHSQLVDTV